MSEFENALNENGLSYTQERDLIKRTDHSATYLTYGVKLYNILEMSTNSEQELDQLHNDLFYQTDFIPSKFEYRSSRIATSFEKVADILENQNLIDPLFESITNYNEEIPDPIGYLMSVIQTYYEETDELNHNELGKFENTFTKAIERADINLELVDFELESSQDISFLFQQLAEEVRKTGDIYSQVIPEIFQQRDYLFDGGSDDWNQYDELKRAFKIYLLLTGTILAIMYALVTGDPSILITVIISLGAVLK